MVGASIVVAVDVADTNTRGLVVAVAVIDGLAVVVADVEGLTEGVGLTPGDTVGEAEDDARTKCTCESCRAGGGGSVNGSAMAAIPSVPACGTKGRRAQMAGFMSVQRAGVHKPFERLTETHREIIALCGSPTSQNCVSDCSPAPALLGMRHCPALRCIAQVPPTPTASHHGHHSEGRPMLHLRWDFLA